MPALIGWAIGLFLLWLVITVLDFIARHWPIFAAAVVAIAVLPLIVGQKNAFLLLRAPVYGAGIVLCALILPLDYAFLFLVKHVGTHVFIGATRAIGAPFVIISSA